jgi:hypothetical protein
MVKPKGKVTYGGFAPGLIEFLEIDELQIVSWCRDEKAQLPPEQVHLIQKIKDLDIPLVMRFKSPDTLGFLIEELARYRREVWPEAECVIGEKKE